MLPSFIFSRSQSDACRALPCRASVLIVVVVMTLFAAIITGSIMSYGLTEARLNRSDQLYAEARLSAEATLHHGMAQLRNRFDRTTQISPLELQPHRTTSLELFPGTLELLGQTRAVVPASYSRPSDLTAFYNMPTVLGALLVNGGEPRTLRIDPFTYLPEQGAPGLPADAQVREVRLYAKSTVQDTRFGSRVAYARQTLQIIDRSFYRNTVFFNGLLEIFPGANMNIGMGGGPIYAESIRIGNNPRIHTRVETSGDFRVGRYHNNEHANSTARLTDMRMLGDSIPANPDSVNYLRDLKRILTPTHDGSAVQSGLDGFREYALQGFNGGLLTSEHGIVGQAAVGLEFLHELALQEAADGTYNNAAGAFDQGLFDRTGGNFGHLLIEPSRNLTDTSTISNEQERRREEAFNAVERNKWSNLSSMVIEFDPATDTVRLFHQPLDNHEPRFNAAGERERYEINLEATFPTETTRFWTIDRFNQPGGSNNEVTGGIYDYRQAAGQANASAGKINLVRVDMEKMRKWVEQSWSNSELGEGGTAPAFDSDWWNGGVYVQLPQATSPARDDRVTPAVSNWAVQVHNAATLPNRYVKDASSPRGLTFATNGALYVQGTYNAPGGTTWNETTYATASGAEVPAALVADAITLLSDNWSNKNSGFSDIHKRVPSNTTHSAALVTGNAPSKLGDYYSGGLENFPRYLERWTHDGQPTFTHTYRGSLIRLFRSETFRQRWGHSNVYSAPRRDWSFHTGYRTFAPVPSIGPRTFRRINFKELTEAEFRAETAALYGVVTSP